MLQGVGSIFAVDGGNKLYNKNQVRSVRTGVRLDRQSGSNEIINLQIELNGVKSTLPSTVATVVIPQNDFRNITVEKMRDAFRRSFRSGQNAHVYILRKSNGK